MHLRMLVCFMHTLPFSTPCDNMLAMLVCTTCWLSMHLYMLAYMFMHESCLVVCRPYLFAFLFTYLFFCLSLLVMSHSTCYACNIYLACLPFRLFTCFLVSLLAMSIMLICFMPLSYALCIFSFHCLSVGFLSLPLHVPTWSEDA